MWELALPEHFEEAAELVTEEQLTETVPCGPDPETHLRAIREYIEAGYDHVCLHQVGPAQEEFIEFFAKELLPRLQRQKTARREAKAA
jgi:hypothetical protein